MHANYDSCIDWLFQQFPSYQFKGASAYKPGLENTLALLDAFGNPQESLKFIHVAGTNGKGSTCSFLTSLLVEKGEKVALFTSPHVYDFRERIRINGVEISQQFVIDFCERIKSINFDFAPSFFEITLAMALCYFQEENCSIVVLETGLGGRLDATNVVTPLISIITNIGIDHTQFLGDTLEAIAPEKAGIIKENIPIVIGQRQLETKPVFEKVAKTKNAPIYFAEEIELPLKIELQGYQAKNLKNALVGLSLLSYPISQNDLNNAIRNLKKNSGLFGRMEKLQVNPTIIIDVSHNKEGIEATLNSLHLLDKTKLTILFGSSRDKDIDAMIKLFPKNAEIHLCMFQNERSQNIERLTEIKEK
ncbi:MAG: bifunctional folylpolyglutamate synthase/dihydrofolate synthase, partial [Crocinitomicaceae bacterium]|nr:bifunctional folylpolyglutamate synthase/dihydrofolate synthase [Crocinitomicaceae bacterium]